MIDTVVVEKPNLEHPFGLRGVGESSIVPPMAAFSNAIFDAVGLRMRQLPMPPAVVVAVLSEKGGNGPAS